ncbi:MAG: prolyl oligopeptidase family serine peptidase [Bacteroidia bacterium]|nr:prolyl oligopeptidase family serine peptidase [Bacteroidia bacterium]
MKHLLLLVYLFFSSLVILIAKNSPAVPSHSHQVENGEYTLVIEGFDWGAAASKVILPMSKSLSAIDGSNFEVEVNRSTSCGKLSAAEASGKLRVLYAYVSDERGNRVPKGEHISLVLYAAPFEQLGSPIKYFPGNQKCSGNQWIDFMLTVTDKRNEQVWNKERDRIIPLIDAFDLSGTFTHEDIDLTYAAYTPASTNGKRPLIIWLHGGGEGGTDPTIPLIANRAANYASPEIQAYFGGAYVLVPQSPTFWMDNGKGQYTRGEVNDTYNESLMALIKDYVDKNPNIDEDRIYVGGCSNGGYMTLKLLLLHPDYFAAAFPSALAYHAKNLKEDDIQRIKDLPIWFIHSKDDPVTRADETAVPAYKKLIEAGAENVHLSYFDHVVDITNQFGGENFHYLGHFSWIYSHANKCQLDYDGKAVMIDGQPLTLMGWMARQKRKSK